MLPAFSPGPHRLQESFPTPSLLLAPDGFLQYGFLLVLALHPGARTSTHKENHSCKNAFSLPTLWASAYREPGGGRTIARQMHTPADVESAAILRRGATPDPTHHRTIGYNATPSFNLGPERK